MDECMFWIKTRLAIFYFSLRKVSWQITWSVAVFNVVVSAAQKPFRFLQPGRPHADWLESILMKKETGLPGENPRVWLRFSQKFSPHVGGVACTGIENVFLDGHTSGSQLFPTGLNFSEKIKQVGSVVDDHGTSKRPVPRLWLSLNFSPD